MFSLNLDFHNFIVLFSGNLITFTHYLCTSYLFNSTTVSTRDLYTIPVENWTIFSCFAFLIKLIGISYDFWSKWNYLRKGVYKKMRTNTLICPTFMKNRSILNENEKQALGRHFTLEFYDCRRNKILSLKKIEKILLDAMTVSGEIALKKSFNYLEEKGISGVVTTLDSSYSIHGWAEYSYVTVDIFTCSKFLNIDEIVKNLEHSLHAENSIVSSDINRGIISNSAIKHFVPNKTDTVHDNRVSWEDKFRKADAWGLASSIDIYECDSELIRNADAIKYFVHELCDLIEMKRFGECQVVYFGEDEKVAGYSMTQLIETSLISGHFANESNTAYLDVFSCKSYQPEVVSEFAKKFFKGGRAKLQVAMRE